MDAFDNCGVNASIVISGTSGDAVIVAFNLGVCCQCVSVAAVLLQGIRRPFAARRPARCALASNLLLDFAVPSSSCLPIVCPPRTSGSRSCADQARTGKGPRASSALAGQGVRMDALPWR
jgi:hypothetical protein